MDRIESKKGKVLFAISLGDDLTKSEVKERTGLSMSTVISSVDILAKEGWITSEEERVATGGKPHAVLNVRRDAVAYGVSYRAGGLYAVAADVKGRILCSERREAREGVPPKKEVLSLFGALSAKAPPPRALAVALNSSDREEMLAELEKSYSLPVIPTSNTAALAYRALWRGGEYPLAILGVGNRVKCALLGEKECRTADLSDHPSLGAFTGEGSCRALLSASRVARRLANKDFNGVYLAEEDGATECRDISAYSRALIVAISGLTESVELFAAPRAIGLFGEYLTEGFFERIRAQARTRAPLFRECPEGEKFALGAALAAIIERVLS